MSGFFGNFEEDTLCLGHPLQQMVIASTYHFSVRRIRLSSSIQLRPLLVSFGSIGGTFTSIKAHTTYEIASTKRLTDLAFARKKRTMSYLKRLTTILRGSLSTTSSTPSVSSSIGAFHLPLRKLVLRYSQTNPSSLGLRTFLLSPRFTSLTAKYPSVEFVVTPAPANKHPLATGFYAAAERQGRRKDVNLANLDALQCEKKLKQVVESSGLKVRSLKRRSVESRSESARGVWSQIHDRSVDV